MSRLPIFHDDRSFREQTERMFREMEESIGLHRPYNPTANATSLQDFMSGTGTPRWPPVGFDDSQFFQLRPSIAATHQVLCRNYLHTRLSFNQRRYFLLFGFLLL